MPLTTETFLWVQAQKAADCLKFDFKHVLVNKCCDKFLRLPSLQGHLVILWNCQTGSSLSAFSIAQFGCTWVLASIQRFAKHVYIASWRAHRCTLQTICCSIATVSRWERWHRLECRQLPCTVSKFIELWAALASLCIRTTPMRFCSLYRSTVTPQEMHSNHA